MGGQGFVPAIVGTLASEHAHGRAVFPTLYCLTSVSSNPQRRPYIYVVRSISSKVQSSYSCTPMTDR